ncbi:membrane protein FxsA [Halovenus sp. WSH3]|uniref:Membrane protein FxsA n=1 Tax=Halovenus carboxidivorans TaxID=2692199 RepID=A0A6B0T4C9_9EURY|nr:FxsA family protein [Halovenus carboxidivorans]MXR50353.1 membrane protein FxsA [Halovenus carboxidivorans]
MLRLIGLLLLIPLLDAILLVVFGWYFNWVLVVLVVVLSALIGLLLARAEGRHTIRKIQRRAAKGEPPTNELIDGALLLVAGAFLLTPGLITDAIGLLLVIPVTRYPFRVLLKKYVIVPYADKKTGGFVTGNVYLGGFPGGDDRQAGPGVGGSDGPDSGDGGGFDDATDVDFEEVDGRDR